MKNLIEYYTKQLSCSGIIPLKKSKYQGTHDAVYILTGKRLAFDIYPKEKEQLH